MKRRSKSEIQSAEQVPNHSEYSVWVSYDYGRLVPSYLHDSIIVKCSDNERTYQSTVDIIYNDVYQYPGTSEYHRDNYLMVPLTVPPMALKAELYNLDDKKISEGVPKVSKLFDLEYDSTFLVTYKLAPVVCAAEVIPEGDESGDFELTLSAGKYTCDESDSAGDPGPCYSCDILQSPLDSITVPVQDVSDEYAYIWQDVWDMSVITIQKNKPTDDSEDTGSGPAVYLCRVVTPPSGSGGTATVEVISVSGSGAVQGGAQMVVNVIG